MRHRPQKPYDFDVVFYLPWIGPLIAPGSGPPPGGAETQIFLLARALARRGHRICLVTFPPVEGVLPERYGSIEIRTRRPFKGGKRGIGKLSEVYNVWRVLGSLNTRTYVQRAAGVETAIVAIIAKARRRRFVYSSANIVDFDFATLARKRRDATIYHLGIRLADRIVVQTPEQDGLCRARFDRKPVVIKSIAERAAPRRGTPKAFLWIGRLTSYKQPLAYVDLARRVPEAKFWMVAVRTGKAAPELAQQLAEAAGGVPNLDMLDALPRNELMSFVEEAVAIVNTSEFEGMPNIFLEGWARGVPALALTHDPDGVITGHAVGAFAQGSSERFAEQARRLWASRGEQTELSRRCRDYVDREHGLMAVTNQWERVLGLHPTTFVGSAEGAAPTPERPVPLRRA